MSESARLRSTWSYLQPLSIIAERDEHRPESVAHANVYVLAGASEKEARLEGVPMIAHLL